MTFCRSYEKMSLHAMSRIVGIAEPTERKHLVRVSGRRYVEPACEQCRDEPVPEVPVIMDRQS